MYYYVLTHVCPPNEPKLIAIDHLKLTLFRLIPAEYSEEGASTDTPEDAEYYNVQEYYVDEDDFDVPGDDESLWAAIKEHGQLESDNIPMFKALH